mmetsp:Transcript_24972/g.45891  ORF Transcript_24972/g.45891 Transcript_24972/m.45891 type:complete len:298 (-) Transcript_24972:1812-2705(-)
MLGFCAAPAKSALRNSLFSAFGGAEGVPALALKSMCSASSCHRVARGIALESMRSASSPCHMAAPVPVEPVVLCTVLVAPVVLVMVVVVDAVVGALVAVVRLEVSALVGVAGVGMLVLLEPCVRLVLGMLVVAAAVGLEVGKFVVVTRVGMPLVLLVPCVRLEVGMLVVAARVGVLMTPVLLDPTTLAVVTGVGPPVILVLPRLVAVVEGVETGTLATVVLLPGFDAMAMPMLDVVLEETVAFVAVGTLRLVVGGNVPPVVLNTAGLLAALAFRAAVVVTVVLGGGGKLELSDAPAA